MKTSSRQYVYEVQAIEAKISLFNRVLAYALRPSGAQRTLDG